MAQSPDRLLIVSQFFWPETIGSSLYMTDLATWMADAFANVTVLTGRPYYPEIRIHDGYANGEQDNQLAFGTRIRRLPTYLPVGGGLKARLISEVVFLAGALAALGRGRVRQEMVVLSLCPSIFAVLAGVLACRRNGRHVAVVHDIQSGLAAELGMMRVGFFLKLLRRLERFALNRADAVIVLSDRMKICLAEQGVHRPIVVLPIWVDTKAIRPLPQPNSAQFTVMYSGNLGRKQGIEQILAMAAILRERDPNVRVLIRGSGTKAEWVSQEIAAARLTNVCLEDLVPPEQLNASLAEANVHLVPQTPGGADFAVPSKVYSIMAAARPFVCTAVPGSTLWSLREAADPCLCVPPNDAEALADAVLSLISDAEAAQAMGARGPRLYRDPRQPLGGAI